VAFYTKGLQPGVDEAIDQAGDVRAVDAGAAAGVEEATEDHDEHAEDDHGHDHGGTDPHFWLDPTRLADAADAFAAAMAEEDPTNASAYEANAAALRTDLEALDEEFAAGLEKCRTRTIVVSHDAFGYLGRRYDLHVVPITGLSPDAEPSAKSLAAIRAEAEEAGVTTVFSERLASPALAQTLASELDVSVAVLDPLEGLTEGSSGDYLSIMRANLEALRTANGCS
jgi:zinc transport system substrate-binding protein